MYLAPQVDKFVFRHIALCVDDPSSLLCVSKPLRGLLLTGQYDCWWFGRWHSTCCPYRPWQYAVVCWHRLHGTTAAQLCSWILRYIGWVLRQRELAGASSSGHEQAAAVTAAASGSAATHGTQPKHYSYEGRFTPFPACWPTSSTVRRAKQLLAKGRAVDALMQLCPNSGALLMPYAARAQNTGLVQELLAAAMERNASHRGPPLWLPVMWLRRSHINQYYYTHLIVCYQALSAGNPRILQTLLMRCSVSSHGYNFPHMLQKLLRHAVRHSNAACIEALLAWDVPTSPAKARVDTNHLAMAAHRTDPWAAEAVAALLAVLEAEQQLKASSMRAACTAACGSGNWDVLLLLLGYAAADPKQHLPVLLSAAVVAGNLAVLQQLLGVQEDSSCGSSRSVFISPSSDQAAAAAEAAQATAQSEPRQTLTLLGLDWSLLDLSDINRLLHVAFLGRDVTFHRYQTPFDSTTTDQLISDFARARSTACVYDQYRQQQQQLAMAEVLWQQLVIASGREAEVVQYIRSEPPFKRLSLFLLDLAPTHAEFLKRVEWMAQHQLFLWPASAADAFHRVMVQGRLEDAADAGDFQQALQLFNLIKISVGFDDIYELHLRAWSSRILVSILGGRLRRAAAAGDAAAVTRIDQLAAVCCFLFSRQTIAAEGVAAGSAVAANTATEATAADAAATAGTAASSAAASSDVAATPAPVSEPSAGAGADADAAATPPWLSPGTADADAAATPPWLSPGTKSPWLCAVARLKHLSLGLTCCLTTLSGLLQHLGISVDVLVSLFKLKADKLASHILAQQEDAVAAASRQGATTAAAAAAASHKETAAECFEVLHRLYIGTDQQVLELQDSKQQLRGRGLGPGADTAQQLPSNTSAAQRIDQEGSSLTSVTTMHQQLHTVLSAFDPLMARPPAPAVNHALGPMPQVLPLWQQCFLVVAAQSDLDYQYFKLRNDPGDCVSAAVQPPAAALFPCSCCSSSKTVQQLLNVTKALPRRLVPRSDSLHPWALGVAAAAVEAGDHEVLRGLLAGEGCEPAWGATSDGARSALVQALLAAHCTPIRNRATSQPMQHQQDMLQLQQWQLNHTSNSSSKGQYLAGPRFATSAAESALLLLNVAPNSPDLLCKWLRAAVRPAVSLPDLERAKAVVAAVAAAETVPAGAKICYREALRNVVNTGDLDLITVVMCWLDRLELEPDEEDEEPAAADDVLEAAVIAGLQGVNEELLGVLAPGDDDGDDQAW